MRRKPKNGRRKVRKFLLITAVILSLTLMTSAAAAWHYLEPYTHSKMDMTLLDIPRVNRPPRILAFEPENRPHRSGETGEARGCDISIDGNNRFTPYESIPPDLINAFIAIEDKRFWRHSGVDPLRTAHAALRYLVGNPGFGGSTITQQLIKNLTGEADTTVDRKLTEIFRAWDLEEQVSKEEILEAYLNIINLGNGCTGVGMAAEFYFSKAPSELTVAECAAIATITNNPSLYDPVRHPQSNTRRRDLILHRMAEEGYITEEERDEAVNTPLHLSPAPAPSKDEPVSWYADLVAEEVIGDLMEAYGYTYSAASSLFYRGGITVETVMDTDLQSIVEDYYREPSHFPEGKEGRPASAFILLDPHTGDILAVAGAVGEKTGDRLQSYATDTRRPAGSCIKPLTVYAPALKKGILTWNKLMEDTPLTTKNNRPWPANADGIYRGRITAGEAMAHSVNTVAVELLTEVGEEEAFAFARDYLGLKSLISPQEGSAHDLTLSSLALGQQSRGVTLRELTAAYSVFTDGKFHAPRVYHRVLDADGSILLSSPAPEGDSRVLTESEAALMTKLLQTVTEQGSATPYLTRLPAMGIQTAGKTGTTQNNCDRRFVGYTPRLLGGVWMGYDYPAELVGIRGNPCVGIWDEVMALCEERYRGAPCRKEFPVPPDLIQMEFCPLSGDQAGEYCTHPISGHPLETGWFLAGTQPRDTCTLHTEPPITLHPLDPRDPDRIPLFPEDILTETEANSDTSVQDREDPYLFPWLRRFFGGRRGRE